MITNQNRTSPMILEGSGEVRDVADVADGLKEASLRRFDHATVQRDERCSISVDEIDERAEQGGLSDAGDAVHHDDSGFRGVDDGAERVQFGPTTDELPGSDSRRGLKHLLIMSNGNSGR